MKYHILIKSYEGEIVKNMGPHSERSAEKIESGANRNLNHDKYFTLMLSEEQMKEEKEGGRDGC